MMKRLFFACLLFLSLHVSSQDLRFSKTGEFKIVQFTDFHYNGSAQSKVALSVVDSVLQHEHPDLIVLTGDVLWASPGKENLLAVLGRISKYNVPFVYEFGNHDSETTGLSNRELYNIARTVKNNLLPDLSAQKELDYTLRIKSHDGKKTAAVLYCMDTHSYPEGFPEDKSRGTYAWLTSDQVQWYRQQSAAFTKENGDVPYPALAFIHIPLPEYHDAVRDENAIMTGTRREAACSPIFNSGMFTAVKECGDVMGIFCGHDHDNDYSVMWHDVLLAYGRYSGGNTVYNHLPCGARIIVLKEGKRGFDTYIRERKGKVLDETTYPDSYVSDDWQKRPLED
jgi:predicted MPP superfamily phosphohydrolase